jgi:hypothetical protein
VFCGKLRNFIFGKEATLSYIPAGVGAPPVTIYLPNPKGGKTPFIIPSLTLLYVLSDFT